LCTFAAPYGVYAKVFKIHPVSSASRASSLDIRLPFAEWETGIATEISQAETLTAPSRIEVETKIEAMTTKTTEQEPTAAAKAAEVQEEADIVEETIETAVIHLVSAPVALIKETDHLNTNKKNAVFFHIVKKFGASISQTVIVAFCKSIEDFSVYFDGAMLQNPLEFDFAKFLTAQK
jgi:hypothetical protein